MPTLCFEGKTYLCMAGETVLECLERNGMAVPNSCRSGTCRTCLMRAVQGTPPRTAQSGLKDTLRAQGYFLPCVCHPETDLEIAPPEVVATGRIPARVLARQPLNHDILRLTLRACSPFPFRPGQFLNFHRADGLTRSYSIAGPAEEEGPLELHVRHLPNGVLSGWMHQELHEDDYVEISGPYGDCFYTPESEQAGLLLIGTGSGLAPLWGILRDALRQGHSGPIRLYHGSWNPEGLYLVDELRRLSTMHPNFRYVPCVDENPDPSHRQDRAEQAAFADLPNLKGWRVYLCGHPEMVKSAKKRAFLAGASLQAIYADPFLLAPPPQARG